ncbi:terpene synthase family protein [Streptomyces luteireticuli]|uniref:terpene synthase family protein n=1 Tax=Streptomyces luteireticuli TaxID=173858 RepID=UPI0035571D47
MSDLCRSYRPSSYQAQLDTVMQEFAWRHGIWVEGSSDAYTHLVAFVYPDAAPERLMTLGKIYLVDFYLNDTIGRDKFAHLAPRERRDAVRVVERIVRACESSSREEATGLDRAHGQALAEIRASADPSWWKGFVPLWRAHLAETHQDRNAAATGRVPTVERYIEERIVYSGMAHAVALVEYGMRISLDRAALSRLAPGAEGMVDRLGWLCCVVAALSNDLFSLEKEFVDHEADTNLVPVLLLCEPRMTFDDAVRRAGAIVSGYLTEFLDTVDRIGRTEEELRPAAPQLAATLAVYARAVSHYVQACWSWQTYTTRYRRNRSIFWELCTPQGRFDERT